MTNRATLVVNGYLELTDDERKQFIDEVNRFHKAVDSQCRNLCKSYHERTAGIVLGPISNVCPLAAENKQSTLIALSKGIQAMAEAVWLSPVNRATVSLSGRALSRR